MLRMSHLPEWVPVKVFSETEEFTVQRATPSLRDATLVVNANP
jgi:hypothetical protein